MKTKTCGECKEFEKETNSCFYFECDTTADGEACDFFELPTNGEKIWQSGYDAVITFAKTWMEKFSCWAEAEAWLNAPADDVCVKQN